MKSAKKITILEGIYDVLDKNKVVQLDEILEILAESINHVIRHTIKENPNSIGEISASVGASLTIIAKALPPKHALNIVGTLGLFLMAEELREKVNIKPEPKPEHLN